MRMLTFARRTAKEILRDPLNLGFGLGFPVVLLLLLSAIQANIPVSMFEIEQLVPGIAVFGLSFMALFTATLVAKDRGTSFLQRLYTTPMTACDFILGYTLPVLPIAIGQSVICYAVALLLGLPLSGSVFFAILSTVPAAVLFIAIGLLCGSVLTDKQVGGICGALLTNLSAWFSGTWFDLELVGGVFRQIAECLPFLHAVELGRAVLNGTTESLLENLLWVSGYAVVLFVLAVLLFLRQMKRH